MSEVDDCRRKPSEQSRLLPFESCFAEIVEADGSRYKMHYLDEGLREAGAPTVLLVHGNPTWSYYYRNLITALRSSMRVVAVDHLGCGLSERVDRSFAARDRVRHLEQLLDWLQIKRFSLVMHDWGGPIGTALALARSAGVEKLVYLNTTLTETPSLPPIIRLAASRPLGKLLTQTTSGFIRLTTSWGAVRSLPKHVKAGYLAPYRSAARRKAVWDFVQDIPFSENHPTYKDLLDVRQKLPALAEKPVLAVWGLKDPCFHRIMLDEICARLPQTSVVEISSASHLVLEDAPERCASAIQSFLVQPQTAARRRDHLQFGSPLWDGFFARTRALSSAPACRVAKAKPFQQGLAVHDISFSELFEQSARYARGLSELGLKAGERVILLVKPGPEFLTLSYAVLALGAVPVFIDPGIGFRNLVHCLKEADATGFIGSPKAFLLKTLRPKLFSRLRFQVCASKLGLPGTPGLSFLSAFSAQPLEMLPLAPGTPNIIAFTSGATGIPKGVIFTADMLNAQLQMFEEFSG